MAVMEEADRGGGGNRRDSGHGGGDDGVDRGGGVTGFRDRNEVGGEDGYGVGCRDGNCVRRRLEAGLEADAEVESENAAAVMARADAHMEAELVELERQLREFTDIEAELEADDVTSDYGRGFSAEKTTVCAPEEEQLHFAERHERREATRQEQDDFDKDMLSMISDTKKPLVSAPKPDLMRLPVGGLGNMLRPPASSAGSKGAVVEVGTGETNAANDITLTLRVALRSSKRMNKVQTEAVEVPIDDVLAKTVIKVRIPSEVHKKYMGPIEHSCA